MKPNQNKITKSQLTKFLEIVAGNEEYDIYNYEATDVKEIADIMYGKSDFEMLQDVSATAIGDFTEPIELFNAVNNTDYERCLHKTKLRSRCYLLRSFTIIANISGSDNNIMMGRGGFEPPKQDAADLQSVPFGHSGTSP